MTGGFAWREGELWAEGVPLAAVAAAVGTPAYVYAAGAIRDAYRRLDAALGGEALICYALKANGNLAVVRTLALEGAGADTVSGGEIERALAAGVPPERIVYAGVGKTDAELRQALAAGVLQFNVESVEELRRLGALAAATGRRAPVALRVNPDLAAGAHDKISTGRRGDKFGIPLAEAPDAFRLAAGLDGIELAGAHVHIGSQIAELALFETAYRRVLDLVAGLRAAGVGLRRLDLGGGFGVSYRDEAPLALEAFGAFVRRLTAGSGLQILLEPGRFLVAQAGLLLCAVVQPKRTGERRFLILDAGMNNLLRPAMYGAYHEIVAARPPAGPRAAWETWDVVGPICESSDLLGRDRLLPPLGAGELVAILGAGAYGATMASYYNTRPSAAEVLVDGGQWAIIKPRHLPAAQFADEAIPDWLDGRHPAPAGDEGSPR